MHLPSWECKVAQRQEDHIRRSGCELIWPQEKGVLTENSWKVWRQKLRQMSVRNTGIQSPADLKQDNEIPRKQVLVLHSSLLQPCLEWSQSLARSAPWPQLLASPSRSPRGKKKSVCIDKMLAQLQMRASVFIFLLLDVTQKHLLKKNSRK